MHNEQAVSTTQIYAGFWVRLTAVLVDMILILLITIPLALLTYDYILPDNSPNNAGIAWLLIDWILPSLCITLFWIYKAATPGKTAMKTQIIDAKTGGKPSSRQAVIRLLAYTASFLPLFMGFLWIAIDKRKQGWHDKLAGTLVIRNQ
ncbi:RDD family protein [Endozoicomonadaceae bacterium StTr2]